MTRPTSSKLSTAIEKHLSSYASAALAGIGALSGAQVAEAQIVTTKNSGQTLTDNGAVFLFTGSGLPPGGGPEVTLAARFSSSSYQQFAGVKDMDVLGAGPYATNLAAGAVISAKAVSFIGSSREKIGYHFANYTDHADINNGNFRGQTGYLGFSFTDPNNAAQTDYGWAEITESANQHFLTLDNAAYDDAGVPIEAGQLTVPEPDSLALLAGGAACLAAWRLRKARRRQASVTEPVARQPE